MSESISHEPSDDKELTKRKQANAASSARAHHISERLNALFAPESLKVVDESGLHKGHAGARPEGETHFRVLMTSERFSGLGRVARQRLVNEALRDELEGGLHALAMSLKAPGEI